LHHGTLLFNTNIEVLRQCIRPEHSGYDDKSVKSADSSITNLKDHLPENTSLQDFREMLKMQLRIDFPETEEYRFDQEDINNIRQLAQDKYMTNEWNFEYAPKYHLTKDMPVQRQLSYDMQVEKGRIVKLKFYRKDKATLTELSKKLINTLHHPKEIEDVLISFNFAEEKLTFDPDEFLSGLF
jgi:lipoate-protein ligase A